MVDGGIGRCAWERDALRAGLALARYEAFPIGTLLANILGSLLIGVCAGMFEGDQKGRPAALFLMIGFCGGFTTFSAFSLQSLDLMQQQAWLKAGGNVVLSVAGCLLGTWLGFLLGQAVKKGLSQFSGRFDAGSGGLHSRHLDAKAH